jgi:hypothetical protein
MHTPLNLVILNFFEYRDTIKSLYLNDDDFKTLCEDYYTSRINMEKFKSRLLQERNRELEFEELSLKLEIEILDFIKRVE